MIQELQILNGLRSSEANICLVLSLKLTRNLALEDK